MTQQSDQPAGSGRRFVGQVVVITGAAGMIGRATARRFAAEGASVVLVDLPGAALDAVAAELAGAEGGVLAVPADVTRWADCAGYANAAAERFGGIDYLFNNAGIEGFVGSMLDYPEPVFDRLMAVNVKGVWLGIKAVVPHLRRRGGGAIVNTSSISGLRGSPTLFAYVASKHAVLGITRSAAKEFGPEGIRVNAICPGPIESHMMDSIDRGNNPADPAANRRAGIGANPLRRRGEPAEVAALVAFLCSPDAVYLNGAAYTIDGGYTA